MCVEFILHPGIFTNLRIVLNMNEQKINGTYKILRRINTEDNITNRNQSIEIKTFLPQANKFQYWRHILYTKFFFKLKEIMKINILKGKNKNIFLAIVVT